MGSISRKLILLALSGGTLLFLGEAIGAQSTAYDNRVKQRSANVSIMAITTFTHQGFAGNQDVYLADISGKDGEHQTARLVDFYAASASPLRRSLLNERRTFHMLLQRTPECDVPARDILVATREANIFDGGARTALGQEDQLVPCYKVDHNATRLNKK